MYKIKVSNKYEYNLEKTSEGLFVNGDKIMADIKQLRPNAWHVIKNNRSYNVELVDFNGSDKSATIKVNNTTYPISSKDQFDILLDQLGLSNLTSTRVSELKAPMPGMVLKVFVEENTVVKKGENLFVLEAMKMENIIKSPDDVVVKSVKIKPGDKVEKGQILLQFQ
ncbi:MAG: biotin/lipoyl-containing protein [Mucilaginibacter sp.]